MKYKDFIKEILCENDSDQQREVVIVLEFDPEDPPEIDDNEIRFAPREVSAFLKNARQFDGEDRDILNIYIKGSDY